MIWECHQKAPPTCRKCDAEAREAEKKKKRNHQLEVDRETKQQAYAKQLAEIQTEIEFYQRLEKDKLDDEARAKVIAQHKKDLEDAKQRTILRNYQPTPVTNATPSGLHKSSPSGSKVPVSPVSPVAEVQDGENETIDIISQAKDEWQHQKDFEGASNEGLDSLMGMIGLENVKQQFLAIKVKVDTVIRQKTDLKDERFGAAFLGNPGTGMYYSPRSSRYPTHHRRKNYCSSPLCKVFSISRSFAWQFLCGDIWFETLE